MMKKTAKKMKTKTVAAKKATKRTTKKATVPNAPEIAAGAASASSYASREEWLRAAIVALRPLFAAHDLTIPDVVHVSCGFPSVRALARKNPTIGECWASKASTDNNSHIFITPLLSSADPVHVLETLAHELVHAVVGHECKHRGAFKRAATAMGLEGRMTSTHAGVELSRALVSVARGLGPYPHAALNPTERPTKKQSTRMLKLSCPEDGYTVRTTRKWIEEMGVPTCPCGREFVGEDGEDGEDGEE